MNKRRSLKGQAGFSLIEMMMSLLILMLIMGTIFSEIRDAQQNSSTEQVKVDLFQESREFMDQLARDLRTAGYPNSRNFSTNPVTPPQNSEQTAAGLVKLDNDELWFEGSIDGSGKVYVVRYKLDTDTCSPLPCLKRMLAQKLPIASTSNVMTEMGTEYETEVQNVLQGSADDPIAGDPIFKAYRADGTAVPMPADGLNIMANAVDIANIDTIAIKITVQAQNPDPKTGQKPTMTLFTTVRLTNCSPALGVSSGTVMGC